MPSGSPCDPKTGGVEAITVPSAGTVGGFGNTPAAGSSSALLATQVSACQFNYSQNASSQAGLLTMLMTLSKGVSSGSAEQVSLFQAVHVNNVP